MEPEFRLAARDDLDAIVRLLADDALGATRERASEQVSPAYREAFEAIDSDACNELVVVCMNGEVVGTLQLTYIPNLTHQGSWRGMIEGVRIRSDQRGDGLGTRLFQWAIDRCRDKGCRIVQLTSDLQRGDAIRFYEQLGFRHSHAGMKLHIE